MGTRDINNIYQYFKCANDVYIRDTNVYTYYFALIQPLRTRLSNRPTTYIHRLFINDIMIKVYFLFKFPLGLFYGKGNYFKFFSLNEHIVHI